MRHIEHLACCIFPPYFFFAFLQLLHSNIQLFTLYNAHLDAAHAFYHHLLFQIKGRFDLTLPNLLDWLESVGSHKKRKEGTWLFVHILFS